MTVKITKEDHPMKHIARIINAIFPPHNHYTATIVYSGMTFHVTIDAPDERRARMELDEIADGGFVIDFAQA